MLLQIHCIHLTLIITYDMCLFSKWRPSWRYLILFELRKTVMREIWDQCIISTHLFCCFFTAWNYANLAVLARKTLADLKWLMTTESYLVNVATHYDKISDKISLNGRLIKREYRGSIYFERRNSIHPPLDRLLNCWVNLCQRCTF